MALDTQPTEDRIRTIGIMVIATIATAAALYWLRPVLIPLVLALLLSYMLSPLVELLIRRVRMPRILAVTVALLAGALIVVVLGTLISSSVQKLARNADAYEARVAALATQAGEMLRDWGVDLHPETLSQQVSALPVTTWMTEAANAALSIVSNTVLVLIFAVFMLQGSALAASTRAGGMRGQISARIERYLQLKVALSAATGALVWLFLLILGVDLALVFGVLAFVLNFIPSVGSIIATLLPIPVVLLDPEFTWTTLILAILLPGSVQMVIGNGIEPKLMGEQLELHPITVLAALTFWGALWGVPGMLLAVPLTATISILLGALDLTRPIARLMAGHARVTSPDAPPPTPPPPPAPPPPATA